MFKCLKGPHELEPAVILPGCSPDLFLLLTLLKGGLCSSFAPRALSSLGSPAPLDYQFKISNKGFCSQHFTEYGIQGVFK